MAGPLAVLRLKPLRLERRLERLDAGPIPDRGEGDTTSLARRPGLCTIDQDCRNPVLERRPSFESAQAAEHAEPGVLYDLLSHRGVSHEHPGKAKEPIV